MFRIKELMKEKEYTQQELSNLVETTQPNLSDIINNKVSPSLEMLHRIADALGVHISELFENPNDNVFRCPHCGTTLKVTKK